VIDPISQLRQPIPNVTPVVFHVLPTFLPRRFQPRNVGGRLEDVVAARQELVGVVQAFQAQPNLRLGQGEEAINWENHANVLSVDGSEQVGKSLPIRKGAAPSEARRITNWWG